jgi:hypothetical protein
MKATKQRKETKCTGFQPRCTKKSRQKKENRDQMYMFSAVYFGEGELTEAKSTVVLTNQGKTWGDSCSQKNMG